MMRIMMMILMIMLTSCQTNEHCRDSLIWIPVRLWCFTHNCVSYFYMVSETVHNMYYHLLFYSWGNWDSINLLSSILSTYWMPRIMLHILPMLPNLILTTTLYTRHYMLVNNWENRQRDIKKTSFNY